MEEASEEISDIAGETIGDEDLDEIIQARASVMINVNQKVKFFSTTVYKVDQGAVVQKLATLAWHWKWLNKDEYGVLFLIGKREC